MTETNTARVWRIHLLMDDPAIDAHAFCLQKGILGIGWAVESDLKNLSWNEYEKLAVSKYQKGMKGWRAAANAINNRMKIDDLCWSRSKHGIYYLGRVTGDWEYRPEQEYLKVDRPNVRKCQWLEVGAVASVPGKIVNSFILGGSVQKIHDSTIEDFSKHKYNQLSGKKLYKLSRVNLDVFSLFSPEDCEDLVGFYLQSLGYYIIPSSAKFYTKAYEYVLKHNITGKEAVVQVKNGNIDLQTDEYKSFPADFYLFTSKGKYLGASQKNVHCIERAALMEFMKTRNEILPEKIKTWISLSAELNNGKK